MFFSHAKRIWSVYATVLLAAAGLLAWFTWFTMRLDHDADQNRRDVLLAEQQAAQRERVSRALWRMDWTLSPLIAQEAARTHWMYQSFLSVEPAKEGGEMVAVPQPSPLLLRPSPWVLLHFQIDQTGSVTSPQSPEGKNRMFAIQCGVREVDLNCSRDRLSEIADKLKFQPLLNYCSTSMLNSAESNSLAWILPQTGMQVSDSSIQNLSSLQPPLPQPAQNFSSQNFHPNLLDNGLNQVAEQQVQVPSKSQSARSTRAQAAEYLQRGQTANNMAAGQWQLNRFNIPLPKSIDSAVTEGALRPIWLEDHLILIRRVQAPNGDCVQGCWLDWQSIKQSLLQEIVDIVPEGAELVPRQSDDQQLGAALATLPVELVAAKVELNSESLPSSPRNIVVLVTLAWIGFMIAGISVGWLIWGVTRLSERRAAFASAVTHELRTPLTTFRLYSEMLASDIVIDQQQRREYVSGLVKESDRLCRLVDNVLQFARLERKQPNLQLVEVSVGSLLEAGKQRCQSRTESVSMHLEVTAEDAIAQTVVRTSVDLVDQILFNLVDNACKYACHAQPPKVELQANIEGKWLLISVRDFGSGIEPRMIGRLFQAFSRSSDETAGTAAGVGLGLSLSRQLAKQLGGKLEYQPANPGSRFILRLPISDMARLSTQTK